MNSNNYWLLLEKSAETRTSQGIDSYQDKTGELYQYDSLVPNYKNLKRGDFVVLRKENDILGVGRIDEINEGDDEKVHWRCPLCNSTDIRERTTMSPKWKCGRCSKEFLEPVETIAEVRSYRAAIEDFSRLNSPPTVKEVKHCALKGDGVSSQLSILQLDGSKLITLLEGVDVNPSPRSSQKRTGGQGFGLSQEERKSVELHAMRIAEKSYKDAGWKVIDMSNSRPFDLLATKVNEKRFIEVKGTTGDGHSIVLTHGEVAHVQKHPEESALMVVANIYLQKVGNRWDATGGQISTHEDPWHIENTVLQATQYRCDLP